VTGLSEPISAKSFNASLTGLLTRRVDVLASAGYSSGESALTLGASVFDTYTGDARVRVALVRSLATYVEYLYYVYDSRGSLPIVPGMPPILQRRSVRAGLMLRIPAL